MVLIPSPKKMRDVYKNATSGKHNVELAELLIQLVGVYPVSSAVQLNTLEKGVVPKVLNPADRQHDSAVILVYAV